MSDFEKVRLLTLSLIMFCVVTPFVVLSTLEAIVLQAFLSVVYIPIIVTWFIDYRKFKRSSFKCYQHYWHYHHNMDSDV